MDNLRANLNAVRVFAQVVESKTFRAAARVLGMPKSTVSLRVAELEEQLGERLLERTTRSLRLSDAGVLYHRRVVTALEALRDAEQTLSDQRLHPSGRLRVTTTFEGGQFGFAAIFAEYARRYPAVELEVLLADRHVDLIEEGVDLAIRSGTLPDSGFIAHRLGLRGSLRCYASPSYLKARGTPRHPRELEHHDCLVMSAQSHPGAWSFTVAGKAVTINVRPRATANSFLVLGEFAKAGLGIARMPDYIATALATRRLRPVLEAFTPTPSNALHALYPSARHLSSKVRALLDLLDEGAQEAG